MWGLVRRIRSQRRPRVGVAVSLLLGVGLVGVPSPGQASTISDLAGSTDPAGSVVQATESAVDSLLGILTDGACAVGEGVGDPAETLLCALDLLTFTVHSVYDKPGGGTVVRDTPVVFGVPTPFDISGNGVMDATATVSLSGLNRLYFSVKKLVTVPNKLSARVELVVEDPTNLSSPSRIAFGIDQRGQAVPYWFRTMLTLTGITPLRFNVDVAQSALAPNLTLVAALFRELDNGARDVVADARVGFSPGPNQMNYDLTLGEKRQHLTVATDPTRIDAKVELIDNDEVQQITATIDELPSKVDIDVATDPAGLRTVEYTAAAPIELIDGRYRQIHRTPLIDIVEMEAYGTVKGLPERITLQQTGETGATFSTHGGAIESVEGGFAMGGTVAKVAPGEAGARMRSGNGKFSVAGRLFGLRRASLELGGPYAVDIESRTQPLHIRAVDTDSGTVIDGHVLDLPAHVALVIDPVNGQINYNAFGEPIQAITLDATSEEGFSDKIKRAHAGLYGIPASFQLSYAASDGGFGASMDNPVDRIELSADDGVHTASVPGTLAPDGTHTGPVDSGASLRMAAPDTFAAAARIYGLRSLAIIDDPTIVTVETAPGHVFDAAAEVEVDGNPISFTAEINELPSKVRLDIGQAFGRTVVGYDAFGSEIGALTVHADGLEPITGRIDTIDATITDIPAKLQIIAGGETEEIFALDTFGDAIGAIEVQALSKGGAEVAFPLTVPTASGGTRSAPDGVVLKSLINEDLTPGEFQAALHLSGVRGASLQLDPNVRLGLDIDPAEAELFGIQVQSQGTFHDLVQNTTYRTAIKAFDGFVDQLPPDMVVDLAPSRWELLRYSAGARIDEIFVRGHEINGGTDATPPKIGDTMKARVRDVPEFLSVCVSDGRFALAPTRCPYDPRPSSWPAAPMVTDDIHGDHLFVAHIDDGGTTLGEEPMTLDFYACLRPNDTGRCSWNAADDTEVGPYQYLKVDDFKIHNLFLDAFLAICGDPGPYQCGHFAIDTNQQHLSGDIKYFLGDIDGIESLSAGVHLPNNFLANDRYLYWDETALLAGPTDTLGSVTCFDETFIGVVIDLYGSPPWDIDGSDYLLGC